MGIMIIDCFMWSYERDAVNIRLKALKGHVGAHMALQATNTFRGSEREVTPLGLPNVTDVFVTIPDNLDPWRSEKWLRDQLLIQATKVYGKDHVYLISDGDEIVHPEAIKEYQGKPLRLVTDYRNFYANWRAKDHVLEHQATIGNLNDYTKSGGANSARWHATWPLSKNKGWHLSSLGDTSREKLKTFAHTEYDKPEFAGKIGKNKAAMKDFLGRFELERTDDIPPFTPRKFLK